MARVFHIVGAGGPVGSTLSKDLRASRETVIDYSHRPNGAAKSLDFLSDADPKLDLKDGLENIVCICSALSKIDDCLAKNQLSAALNVRGPIRLLESIIEFPNIVPVFFSSDMVFDGKADFYDENSICGPINIYGSQKLEVEETIAKLFPKFLILRMSKILGNFNDNVLVQQIESLRRGLPLTCFTDQLYAPLYVKDIAPFVLRALAKQEFGIFHLAQDKAMSRFDMATQVAKILGAAPNLVRPARLSDMDFVQPRPLRTYLKNDRARRLLGFEFRQFDEILRDVLDDRERGHA